MSFTSSPCLLSHSLAVPCSQALENCCLDDDDDLMTRTFKLYLSLESATDEQKIVRLHRFLFLAM